VAGRAGKRGFAAEFRGKLMGPACPHVPEHVCRWGAVSKRIRWGRRRSFCAQGQKPIPTLPVAACSRRPWRPPKVQPFRAHQPHRHAAHPCDACSNAGRSGQRRRRCRACGRGVGLQWADNNIVYDCEAQVEGSPETQRAHNVNVETSPAHGYLRRHGPVLHCRSLCESPWLKPLR
jgi:hypothetical protein